MPLRGVGSSPGGAADRFAPYDQRMPGLAEVRAAAPPVTIAFGVDRVYPSPDRHWAFRLRDHDEIRMGAYVWRTVDVVRQDGSVPAIRLTLADRASWPVVDCYVPWDATSSRVVAATLRFDGVRPTGGFAIFDVHRGIVTEGHADGWVRGAAWSPTDDQFLLATRQSIRIVSAEGAIVAAVDADLQPSASVVGWTPSGSSFFCLQSHARESVLRFFDPTTGERVADAPLDPESLVPYDASEYAGLDRVPYCLKVNSGTWATGSLLDNWSMAEYDATQSTLHLSVYRPTSPVQTFPRPDGGEVLGCEVRPMWISATVVD